MPLLLLKKLFLNIQIKVKRFTCASWTCQKQLNVWIIVHFLRIYAWSMFPRTFIRFCSFCSDHFSYFCKIWLYDFLWLESSQSRSTGRCPIRAPFYNIHRQDAAISLASRKCMLPGNKENNCRSLYKWYGIICPSTGGSRKLMKIFYESSQLYDLNTNFEKI